MIKRLLVVLIFAMPLCGMEQKDKEEKKRELEKKRKELWVWRAAVCCVKGMRCTVKPLMAWCCKGKK